MGATAAVHPTDHTLQAYGLGKLDDASSASVSKHIESCGECQRRVAEVSSDSFLGRLRHAQGQSGFSGHVVSSLAALSMLDSTNAASAARPPSCSLPPGLADHPVYEVIRELGQGGMGTVYLALNRLMGRHEVLKVVSSHLMSRRGVLDRFMGEIRNAARLHHTNIVTAYAAMPVGESIVFAMEYVDGRDLAKVVKAKGALPVANACYYVHQAALGLEHAHEQGMVHRDIKPSNLMLAKLGNRAVIKVLDFGLAKVKSEGAVHGGLTHEGQMLGTPEYVAPEQTVDARTADIRADIYSLGCTLYCLLAGGPPFQATSLYELLQAHHSMDALPLNLARPEVPVELAAVVARMMAKEPKRRFQEPKEVSQALMPFFKKASLPSVKVDPRVSHARQSDARPLTLANGVMPTAPVIGLKSGTVREENSRPEPQWESLIALNTDEPLKEPAVPSPGRRIPRRFGIALIVASVLGLLALGVIIYVATDYGRIKIVLNDPKAVVKVDGQEVHVESLGEPITLRAKEHTLVVTWGDGEFETKTFKVYRGIEEILRVEHEPKRAPNTADGSDRSPPPTVTELPKPVERSSVAEDTAIWPLRSGNFVEWNGLQRDKIIDPVFLFQIEGEELVWAGQKGRIYLNSSFRDFSFKFEFLLPVNGRIGTAFSGLRLAEGEPFRIGAIPHRVGQVVFALTDGEQGRTGDIVSVAYNWNGPADFDTLERKSDFPTQINQWIDAEIRCEGREIKCFLTGRLVNRVFANRDIIAHPGFTSWDTDIRLRNVCIAPIPKVGSNPVRKSTSRTGDQKKSVSNNNLESNPADLLQPGTEWKGELIATEEGETGDTRFVTFIVLERDGERFKARWEGPIVTFEVWGRCANGEIAWLARDAVVENGRKPFADVSGTFQGEGISIHAQGVNSDNGKRFSVTASLRLKK